MTPVFAQSGGTSVLGYYIFAIIAGLAVALVFRKPKGFGEALELVALSLGGLLLLMLAAGAVGVYGTKNMKALMTDPLSRAGALGVFVALGGSLWGLLRETAQDTNGMNIFEAWAWMKSGGKVPRVRKQR